MRARFQSRWVIAALLAVLLMFPGTSSAQSDTFPEVIPLPDGWQPEGIAIGTGHTFYSGSRLTGGVYRGDLRTGAGEIFVPGEAGRSAVGLKYDQRCDILLVSGGGTGHAYIYDGQSGELLRDYTFSAATTFVNDVVVTNDAAYFTDSQRAVLYRVDLKDCSDLPTDFETIPLSGDWVQIPQNFNANGIVADQSGKTLIVVNSTTGMLYRVDPDTGEAEPIDLGGQSVSAGDGLALRGSTLYVVRNRLNQVLAFRLNSDWTEGTLVDTYTSPYFDVPTTIGFFGNAFYAINARFSTPATPTTPYSVVRVELNTQ